MKQIQTYTNALVQSGIVTGYSNFEFTRSLNSVGTFKIEINYNNINAKYLAEDKIIYAQYEDKNGNLTDLYGYIDKTVTSQQDNKSNEILTVEGVEVKDRLDRIIYPLVGEATDKYTNEYLETIVKSLINKNAGSDYTLVENGSSDRQISVLQLASDQNRGTQIDYSARYKDLSTEIYTLLQAQEMGLKADCNFTTQKIIWDVFEGNDLTATEGVAGGIVLSLATKTALSIVDTNDRLTYRNVSITAGQGEGADRTILEVKSGTPTGFARREIFTDARDIADDDEIQNRGEQKLALTAVTRCIAVSHNELGSYQVGDDFDLGDYISVETTSGLYDAQIVKVKYTFAGVQVPRVDLTLDFDTQDLLASDIEAKHMDYEALVSTDTSGGGGGTGDMTKAVYDPTGVNDDAFDYDNFSNTPSIPNVPLTTKGDILGYSTANARIPVGTNGYALKADSSNALGVSYQASREVLTTNRVYYTKPGTGTVTGTGTLADPWTGGDVIGYAVSEILMLDINIYNVGIDTYSATGSPCTYTLTKPIELKSRVGAGKIAIYGNTANKDDVVIEVASGAYGFNMLALDGWQLNHLKIKGDYPTSNQIGIFFKANGTLLMYNMTFENLQQAMLILAQGVIDGQSSTSTIKYVGTFLRCITLGFNSSFNGATVTFDTTSLTSFTDFIRADVNCSVDLLLATYTNTAIPGRKWYLNMGCNIQRVGATLPGNTAGVAQYGSYSI